MNKIIQQIMCDALDGPAITYWAKVPTVVQTMGGEIEMFIVKDGDPDGTGPVKKGTKKITDRALLHARNRIVNGHVRVRRDLAAQFVGKPDDWDYDDEGIDVLIQIAFFGELAYG